MACQRGMCAVPAWARDNLGLLTGNELRLRLVPDWPATSLFFQFLLQMLRCPSICTLPARLVATGCKTTLDWAGPLPCLTRRSITRFFTYRATITRSWVCWVPSGWTHMPLTSRG